MDQFNFIYLGLDPFYLDQVLLPELDPFIYLDQISIFTWI